MSNIAFVIAGGAMNARLYPLPSESGCPRLSQPGRKTGANTCALLPVLRQTRKSRTGGASHSSTEEKRMSQEKIVLDRNDDETVA